MPTDLIFTDWAGQDVITAQKLNLMKNAGRLVNIQFVYDGSNWNPVQTLPTGMSASTETPSTSVGPRGPWLVIGHPFSKPDYNMFVTVVEAEFVSGVPRPGMPVVTCSDLSVKIEFLDENTHSDIGSRVVPPKFNVTLAVVSNPSVV